MPDTGYLIFAGRPAGHPSYDPEASLRWSPPLCQNFAVPTTGAAETTTAEVLVRTTMGIDGMYSNMGIPVHEKYFNT